MKSLLPTILVFTFFFFSCPKDCPPDEKIGDLNLKTTTLSYSPYSGTEKLVFKNSSGDSIILQSDAGKQISQDRLCVREICEEPKIKGEITCEYFASESHSLLFRDPDQTILLEILLASDLNKENSENFYSFLRVGFSNENSISSAGLITEQHFNGNLDLDALVINNILIEKDEITLNTKSFSNVYAYEESTLKYYYTKEEGLVGFITTDNTYHLD